MLNLDDISDSLDGLEIKRALAVKMILHDFKVKDICNLLEVSDSFVSKWKVVYENEGAEGLRVHYKGGTGFLTETQRYEIFFHLKDKPYYSVEELRDWIELHYGVVYQSRQSYYDMLKEAGLSWHQTQPINEKRDEDKVMLKREEIKKKLEEQQAEIIAGEVIVFAEDECHLLSGDTTGYLWGRRNQRIEIPIENPNDRQTYYGALNFYNKDFVLTPYDRGNGENTVCNRSLPLRWQRGQRLGSSQQRYVTHHRISVNQLIWQANPEVLNSRICGHFKLPISGEAPRSNP